MRIALIADRYLPSIRFSVAVQLRDLSQELVRQGRSTMIISSADFEQPWLLEDMNGVEVATHIKDIGYVRRAST